LHFFGNFGLDLGCVDVSIQNDCSHKRVPRESYQLHSSVPGLARVCECSGERGVE
jgi:hypothetical protein